MDYKILMVIIYDKLLEYITTKYNFNNQFKLQNQFKYPTSDSKGKLIFQLIENDNIETEWVISLTDYKSYIHINEFVFTHIDTEHEDTDVIKKDISYTNDDQAIDDIVNYLISKCNIYFNHLETN